MKRFSIFYLLVMAFGFSVIRAQTAAKVVLRIDAAMDNIVGADAKLEKVFEGSGFFEGPTWVHEGRAGYLIFSDIPGNVINKLEPAGNISPVVDHIFTGTDTSVASEYNTGTKKLAMTGPNGTTLDRQGRIVYCAYGTGQVVRIEKDGKRTILAERFEGKRLNHPNDLVYKSDGALYFTDSGADLKRAENDPNKGVASTGVYLLKDGKLQLLAKDFAVPNGLALSSDGKRFYVNDSRKETITAFDVEPNDTIANPHILIDMTSDKTVGNPDGMKVDKRGNVYCTGPGGLWIISPGGRHIGTILTPERLTNLTFGDDDGKTLYMTSAPRNEIPSALYRIRLKVEGVRP